MTDSKELKTKFATGKIPSQGDFSELITFASKARTVLGIEADNVEEPLKGLKIESGKLKLALHSEAGLELDTGELRVQPGPGIKVDSTGVHLSEVGDGILPLNKDNPKIALKTGAGLTVDSHGLKVLVGDGLDIDDKGIKIKAGAGLTTEGNNLSIKYEANKSGLTVDGTGLKINVKAGSDNNLTINEKGELALTSAAMQVLVAGSTTRFTTALTAAKKLADDKKITLTALAPIEVSTPWEQPIEKWIEDANTWGEGRIERARKFFESSEGIAKLVTGYEINIKDVHLNFTTNDSSNSFFGENDIFPPSCLLTIDDEGFTPTSTGTGISYTSYPSNHFYVFMAKIDMYGKYKNDSKTLTSNAVMVYISKDKTYLIGYWDIKVPTVPKWYLCETDPRDIIRLNKALTQSKKDVSADLMLTFTDIQVVGGETWDTPITALLKEANSYKNSELYRAKLLLPEFLMKKDYIKGVTYDSAALNFSFGQKDPSHSDYLFSCCREFGYFYSNEVYVYHFSANGWSDVNDITGKGAVYEYSSTLKGFFAVIGKAEQESLPTNTGDLITCNAIMYHINSASDVSVVGYFDLTLSTPQFYPVEADPHYNDITRKPEDLKLTPPSTIYADTNNVTLVPTGGNSGKITYSSKNADILDVDKDTGKLIPKKWSDTAVEITAKQAATRTKNACSTTLDITVTPKINTAIAPIPDLLYKFEQINQGFIVTAQGGNPGVDFQWIYPSDNFTVIKSGTNQNTFVITPLKSGTGEIELKQAGNDCYKANAGIKIKYHIEDEFVIGTLSAEFITTLGAKPDITLIKCIANKEYKMSIDWVNTAITGSYKNDKIWDQEQRYENGTLYFYIRPSTMKSIFYYEMYSTWSIKFINKADIKLEQVVTNESSRRTKHPEDDWPPLNV